MKNLNDTIARLAALRKLKSFPMREPQPDRLQDLSGFGTNPGKLRARVYVPADLAAKAPLVVVLHGCTQTAAGYDHDSGWSRLAERHGFALLFPEQQRANNPNLCFNWFEPGDIRRGRGEALSIRQMVEAMVRAHGLDPTRVFVTGLSAGGAMAAVMLAAYPEVFAGGAVIAGLPYGSAASVPEAFDRMRGHGGPDAAELVARVRAASPHKSSWPTLSVWHGSGDATVNPVNADAIVAQWRALHELGAEPTRLDNIDGYPRQVWCDARGREVIEQYSITGMGHGTPLASQGEEGLGAPGPFMLEASISSTRHIARFWGLTGSKDHGKSLRSSQQPAVQPSRGLAAPQPLELQDAGMELPENPSRGSPGDAIRTVIEDALRAAGLMRP